MIDLCCLGGGQIDNSMTNGTSNLLHWYCGTNATQYPSGFVLDLDHTIYNTCFANLVYAVPHVVFITLAVIVLFILGCCSNVRKRKHTYLIPYPGHYLRWILYLVFILLVAAELGESVLSVLKNAIPASPHLYIPAVLSSVAAVISIVYYNQMELWKKPHMCWLLLAYWLTALTVEVARYLNLINDGVGYTVLRLDLNVAAAVVYGLLVALELNVIVTKVMRCCNGRQVFPEDLLQPNMHFMQGYSNFLSAFMYSWLGWLYIEGYRHSLEYEDLGILSEDHTVKYQSAKFIKALEKETKRAQAKKTSLSMFRVYCRAYGWDMFLAGLCRFLGDTAAFIPPFAVAGIITYVTNVPDVHPSSEKYILVTDFIGNGYVLGVILFLATSTRGVALQGHYQLVIVASAHVQIALQTAIYKKSLRLSNYSPTGDALTIGQITNHMSVDAINVLECFQIIFYFFSIPYLCIGYLIILYLQLGLAALIGFFVVASMIFAQTLIAKRTGRFQKQALSKSDDRLKRTNELLQGIKLIKLYGWEDMFYSAITKVRAAEIWALTKQISVKAFLLVLSNACVLLVTLVSFVLYNPLTGKHLTPTIAFASLTAFSQLFFPLFVLPYTLICTTNAVVSTGRLRRFFQSPEINSEKGVARLAQEKDSSPSSKNGVSEKTKLLTSGSSQNGDFGTFSSSSELLEPLTEFPDDVACRIKGVFTWDVSSDKATLPCLDLDIPQGKLTMVVGQVGAGKSSLLSAILGEMTTVSGGVQWNDKCTTIAYGAQKPWLLNDSLRENILFGNVYNAKRYKKVIAACSLQPDIDILPGGDQTEIGEKGINLSGGQKQRVSVARAMYSHTNVVILDDPLSALDAHVGGHLFKEGILGLLMNKGKRTVLLVTHQIQCADKADKVVYMKDGRIAKQGSIDEIRQDNPRLVITSESDSEMSSDEGTDISKERAVLAHQVSVRNQDNRQGRLVQTEERVKGSVSWRIYLTYIRAIGVWAFSFLLFFAVFQNGLVVATNYWLSLWSEAAIANQTEEEQTRLLDYYVVGYAGLTVGSIIAGALTIGTIFLFSLLAGKRLHNSMLKTIMHAPMRFFDTTPIGRIVNRFSSDTNTIDQVLGTTLNSLLKYWLTCISAIAVNIAVTWYFAVTLIPFIIIYLLIMKYFIKTSRELQRLTNISKSPVFAHFTETLGGLSTIRAYRQQDRFFEALVNKIETNNIMFIYLNTSNRWLGTRLEVIGGFIVLMAALTTTIVAVQGLIVPSLVGLAIAYSINASNQLNWMIRSTANMEMQLNSIERVDYYKNIDTEQYNGSVTPPHDWPDKGEIVYESLSARYDRELDPVLLGVELHFKPGEKIGICGRTGSGKSSLTLSLFRIIDNFQGNIFIDGINISKLPLLELRRRIAIIPQEPVMFIGTIRFNLDGSNEHSDDTLWEALEIAQLKDTVSNLDRKLDTLVTEGGENFSVGQRQLFCLARAFLRKTRILVMDEATASIDLETDEILQQVVSTAFADRTIINIAHRVSSIVNSDRVLVLKDGEVAEFDTPDNLLSDSGSIFSSMVDACP